MGNQAEKYIFALIFAASKDSVAQLVEHLPFKERVLGSSPSQVTLLQYCARGGIGRRASLRG